MKWLAKRHHPHVWCAAELSPFPGLVFHFEAYPTPFQQHLAIELMSQVQLALVHSQIPNPERLAKLSCRANDPNSRKETLLRGAHDWRRFPQFPRFLQRVMPSAKVLRLISRVQIMGVDESGRNVSFTAGQANFQRTLVCFLLNLQQIDRTWTCCWNAMTSRHPNNCYFSSFMVPCLHSHWCLK